MRASLLPFLALAVLLGAAFLQEPTPETTGPGAQEPGRVLSERVWHLGDDETPEWTEAPAAPDHSRRLTLEFEAEADANERALEIQTRHVDGDWWMTLNGTPLGRLRRGKELATHLHPVPGGTLRDGANELVLEIERVGDDITVGAFRLLDRSFREILQIAPLRLKVVDAEGAPVPARLTVVRGEDQRAELYYGDQGPWPVRPGFAYTDAQGEAVLQLSAGDVTVWASRGPEWSVAQATVEVGPGAPAVELVLQQEVDTHGWVSIDTHLHTFTFSGHGDASLDERLMSLAGEGLDYAVATDHNHQTDYAPRQKELGLDSYYTSIVGNEVTTPVGHFNAFPMDPTAAVPTYDLEDWFALTRGMREAGAEVIVLNHPRWPSAERGPFGKNALDPQTGIFATGLQLPVDAIEVFNTTVVATPWRTVLMDWFGLLNHGTLVRGVATSDSHTVIDPAGQGRTYVPDGRASDAHGEVGATGLESVWQGLRQGNSVMSQGLFLEVLVDGLGPGALVPAPDPQVETVLRVACASWASAERVEFWVNGSLVREIQNLPHEAGQPTDVALPITVELPREDCWLVVLVEGPKPEGPWWYTLQDSLCAVSNPVFLDRDGDGRWSSPKRTAEILLEAHHDDPEGLEEALKKSDAAVRAQVDALLGVHEGEVPEEPQR